MNKKKSISVYTDFDGTVSAKDIGDELFKELGEFEPLHSELDRGDISIGEYWKAVFATLPPEISKEDIELFTMKFDIDPYFKSFTDWCNSSGIPITVVSDGYDAYIYPVLKRAGIEGVNIFCNEIINNGFGPAPKFTFESESCLCPSASCKRNIILTNSPPDDILVYIGDGASDYCAAEHCDVIFAKKKLAAYCNEKRIPHYPYNTYFDILRLLRNLVDKNNIRVRRQAELLRKKAFETE